jgi:hypothetical protein
MAKEDIQKEDLDRSGFKNKNLVTFVLNQASLMLQLLLGTLQLYIVNTIQATERMLHACNN